MSDPATITVSLAPLSTFLDPIIQTAVPIIVTAAVGYAAMLLRKWTGVAVSAANQATVVDLANEAARVIWAKAENGITNASIKTDNPVVATAAAVVLSKAPDTAKALGMNSESVANMITAELGRLQAHASAVPPSTTATQPVP
jgi:hypothetical protein